METVLLILARTASVWLSAVSFAMIARMLLPLFINTEGSRLFALAYIVSEPAVIPVRAAMKKMDIGQNSPFDISFTVTYFLILIIKVFLP